MPPRFALGYKQDSKDYGYPTHHRLVAAAPPSLPKADHIPFREGLIWQDGVGMCVGGWFKRMVQLWQAANGFATDAMISGKFSYDLARAQAYAGINPDIAPALVDEGCEPGLLLRAAHEVGITLDSKYPDPTSPAWDPTKVNQRPTPDDCVDAYDARGVMFSRVTRGAWGFKESIRACMVRRQPVGFSMFVDTGFMLNRGSVITTIYTSDPEGGGHMLGVLDASREDYVVIDNWWDEPSRGIDWGMPEGNVLNLPRGTGRIAWATLERAVQQCFAVTAVPFVRKAA